MAIQLLGKTFRGHQPIRLAMAKKIYGLGIKNATRICSKLGIYPFMRFHQLNESHVLALTKELNQYTIEDDARRQLRENIAVKRSTGSYVGRRHAMGLPVRGQNTRNNAMTARKLNRVDRRG
ncbi:hypothetical protein CANCADRAFT_74003 [Tortispora caseinolytica NRRL Y-17796]|uniref:Ribosomal protein S13 n=1 Tax=Tortispora caseinolytica NRRL Y-17796 TaxID=767744 RepID=A0A1E4TIS9_9ASCO|nr:hypothetical protein CANCADRAFT_74003 [Tortispora caseinolytica NRRL Y-17796]